MGKRGRPKKTLTRTQDELIVKENLEGMIEDTNKEISILKTRVKKYQKLLAEL